MQYYVVIEPEDDLSLFSDEFIIQVGLNGLSEQVGEDTIKSMEETLDAHTLYHIAESTLVKLLNRDKQVIVLLMGHEDLEKIMKNANSEEDANEGDHFFVPIRSSDGERVYNVTIDNEGSAHSCECPAWKYNPHVKCKHMEQAQKIWAEAGGHVE